MSEYISVNSWTSSGYVSRNVVNSSSELSRLKSRMGIRVGSAARSSEFIIINKIKREINAAVAHANEKMRVTYDRLTSKLDRLSLYELEWLQFLLGEFGFNHMISQLQIKATSIRKAAMKWQRSKADDQGDIKATDDELAL